MFRNQIVVTLLRRFDMQIHVAVVNGRENGLSANHHHILEQGIILNAFAKRGSRNAVYVARSFSHDRSTCLLTIKGE